MGSLLRSEQKRFVYGTSSQKYQQKKIVCLQALLNVEVIQIQKYAKISGANSEKKIRMDSTVLSFFKQVLLLWFQDYCKRSERLQNYGFK